MITALHLVATLVVAGLFLTSGVLKLRDRAGALAGVRGFSFLPEPLVPVIARVLPYVEIALGVLLLVTWGSAFTGVAALALALAIGFVIVVGLSLARGERPTCHCFGEVSAEPISERTLLRNVAIALSAAAALLLDRPFPGVVPSLVRLGAAEVAFALTATVLVATAAILWSRLDAARRSIVTLTSERDAALARPAARPTLDIPEAAVLGRDGAYVPLADLAREKAQLVIGVSPTCSVCKELSPAFAGWRAALDKEVGVTIVSWADLGSSVAAYPDDADFLYADPDGRALGALGIGGTPGAVVLGTNGKVAAGPALGGESIMELITAVIQAIGVNMMTGMAHQAREPRPIGGSDSGQEHLPDTGSDLQDFLVRTETGEQVPFMDALASVSTGPVPVVAWRDSCPYCSEIAAEMVQFSERGEVVLLVNEPISSVRSQGLTGPAFQTVDIDASGILGLPGTPAGFPVEEARVGAGGGVGGGSVLRMLVERARAKGTLVETPATRQVEQLQLQGGVPDPEDRELLPVRSASAPSAAQSTAPVHAHADHAHGHAHAGHAHDH
ncbi:methylamine utilization protein MauE [Knoellia remsis]|uniref:Methylamine utilization protein MauE n=1 Tax=Knoellia remsis TaxID=407159 RepID=A0A2T0V0J7_9MICO|nr:MauE/DoxX family redox-associated membrane protein [Knoellia remsis]PRY63637.1 methylamine utilization protein MauE [Knoellia remsis]